MRHRLILASLVLTALAARPLAGWSQFEHPDLKSGKKVVRSVVVLPPQVQILKSGVKGNEPLIEESRKVEEALPGVLQKTLAQQGCKVLENPFTPQAFEKDADLKYAVADFQTRFDKLREQLDRKPKDVRQGRFTLGDEVSRLNPGSAADALVFVRAEGLMSTGGKKAFATIFGGLSGAAATADRLLVHTAVVDAQSGAILYYGRATVGGNFADPEKMAESMQKSFKNFVGPPKEEPKAPTAPKG